MMREPPGLPVTMRKRPFSRNDGWRHGRERSLTRCNCVARTLHQAVHVRRAGFRGEVVHFVVEQKSRVARNDACAEPIVNRVRHRDGIPQAIDDRVSASFRGLRCRRSNPRAPRPTASLDPGESARVVAARTPATRSCAMGFMPKSGIAEIGVAIGIGQALGFRNDVQRANVVPAPTSPADTVAECSESRRA